MLQECCRPRYLRWLFQAENVNPSLGPDDWTLLAGMGSGAVDGVQAAGGLSSVEEAQRACSCMAQEWAASGASAGASASSTPLEYRVDDLICFLCLSGHAEATASPIFPPMPAPVTIAEDLGLGPLAPLPLARLSSRGRWKREALVPKARAQPLARLSLLRRRWKRGTLERSRARASFHLEALVVSVTVWLEFGVAVSVALWRCCRGLQHALRSRAGLLQARVGTKVANLLADAGAVGVGMLQARVTPTTLSGVRAAALHVVEGLPISIFLSDARDVLAFVVVRVALKMEARLDDQAEYLKLVGDAALHARLRPVECFVVMAIGRASPQPLARRVDSE